VVGNECVGDESSVKRMARSDAYIYLLKIRLFVNKQWRRVVIIGGGMPIIQHVVWPRDIYSQPLVAGLSDGSDGIEETPAELSRAEPASTQRFTQR